MSPEHVSWFVVIKDLARVLASVATIFLDDLPFVIVSWTSFVEYAVLVVDFRHKAIDKEKVMLISIIGFMHALSYFADQVQVVVLLLIELFLHDAHVSLRFHCQRLVVVEHLLAVSAVLGLQVLVPFDHFLRFGMVFDLALFEDLGA